VVRAVATVGVAEEAALVSEEEPLAASIEAEAVVVQRRQIQGFGRWTARRITSLPTAELLELGGMAVTHRRQAAPVG